MTVLVATSLGALTGMGLYLIISGMRGRRLLPSRERVFGTRTSRETALAASLAAVLLAVVVYLLTGWPVAAIGVAGLMLLVPRSLGARRSHDTHIARTNAIAAWTEMIRDNMAGAAGLEQALQAAAGVAPEPIAPELRRFGRNLDRLPLVEALAVLGHDLDHPSADLVVAALSNAAVMEARELGPLLGRLAGATRADTRMRERVEVGRARIRTSARIVVVTTLLTMVFLWVFAAELLVAYDSPAGQLWLCVVAAVFVIGGSVMRHFARFDVPDRFTARRIDAPATSVAATTGPIPGGGVR